MSSGAERWITWAAVAVRVVAAGILVFGPWTDEAGELDGWDVDRFQQIADAPGAPYIDHEVEYPPGSVVVVEYVLADDVVSSHRRLVFFSLLVDLGLAATLAHFWSRRAATAYLLIGLPLIPSGLLRLDLWAALAAVIAAAAIAPARSTTAAGQPGRPVGTDTRSRAAWFALATVTGAMIKLWPALLIAAALGIRKQAAAASAFIVGLIAGGAWLAVSGTESISQITSLRGVTGWHLESIPGSLVALVGSSAPRLEADAYRIGTLNDTIVFFGRVVTIGLTILAAGLARKRRQDSDLVALVMLTSASALIVTAPLLSPQFLLWLTPWAAILHRDRLLVALTAGGVALTAGTLAIFGPPDLDHPAAAIALLCRDALLIAVVGIGMRRLTTQTASIGSDRLEYA